MEMIALAVLIGLIPAAVAHGKGKNFFLWWLYGAGFFIIALPHSIVMKDASTRQCPRCAEDIRKDATACRFCGWSRVLL